MFWIELRCDIRSNVGSKACYSDLNEGPMDSARSTFASVKLTLDNIEREAVRNGWKKCGTEWICPACQVK